MGDHEEIPSFLPPSRHMERCCLNSMNFKATALGENFPSTTDHPTLLASSSLRSGSVLRSHFSVRWLERFIRVRLVLRRLHLCYLQSLFAQLSQLGISWRLWGLRILLCAGCLVGKEFYGVVLNACKFLLYTYLVCWHSFTCIRHFFIVAGWEFLRLVIMNL